MEAKHLITLAVGIIFFVVALPLTLYVMDSSDNLYAFMGELNQKIPGGERSSGKKQVESAFGVSPNLATCRRNEEFVISPVNCCPPTKIEMENAIDYEFPDPTKPLRVRRPITHVDEEFIAKYQKAMALMRSLPYTDPRSFARQADVHCIFCTGAYYHKNSNITFLVHKSWLFLPWHRMFLHFHERILGSLIGDDSFAVPFWTWDIDPEGMMLPKFFLNGSLVDENREYAHFPPRIVDLNFAGHENGLSSEEQVETNMAVMYHQMVSGAKKLELFMGCRLRPGEKGFCYEPGTMENSPHDTAHWWVGKSSNPANEDMGQFYSAGRDPLFFVHHSNIDRLWDVWRDIHKSEDMSDPDLLDSYFYFYDEKAQLVRIKVRDVLDLEKLRVRYERINSPWLNARPKPSVPPKVARNKLQMRESQNVLQLPSNSHYTSSDFRPHGRPLDTSITVKVRRPQILRSRKEKEEKEEVLVIQGIDVKDNSYVKFDVYINVVDETKISPKFREFAGTYTHIPRGVRYEGDPKGRKHNLKLGISEVLEDLEAEGDESIWVTLLPKTKSCANTSIDGMSIEYLG